MTLAAVGLYIDITIYQLDNLNPHSPPKHTWGFVCLLPELHFPLVGLYNCSYVLELANVKILLYFHGIVQADSGDSIVKQVLLCLVKCNRLNKFTSDETQKRSKY